MEPLVVLKSLSYHMHFCLRSIFPPSPLLVDFFAFIVMTEAFFGKMRNIVRYENDSVTSYKNDPVPHSRDCNPLFLLFPV